MDGEHQDSDGKNGVWHQHDSQECALGVPAPCSIVDLRVITETTAFLQGAGCLPKARSLHAARNSTWFLSFNFHADVVGTVLKWSLCCNYGKNAFVAFCGCLDLTYT